MFKLEKQVESAAYNIRWWFELPDEEAYKRVPKSSINFSRTYNQRLEVYPGWLGVAVALTTDEVRNDPYFRDHIRMYLDGYHKGWDFFQEFSKKFSRFGLQPIQDRRQALFERFVKCRAKYKGSIFFQASLLTKMGYWAGFMFALAQELIEMDAIIPAAVQQSDLKKKPGRPRIDISQVIPDRKNYDLVIKRIREAILNSSYDKAKAVADEIKFLQKENIIVKNLDTRVKCLHDFLAAEIPDLPCYGNVVENIDLNRIF